MRIINLFRFINIRNSIDSYPIDYINIFENITINFCINQTLDFDLSFLILFKNKTCFENSDINIPDMEKCYKDIENNLNIHRDEIVSAYLKSEEDRQNKILFFNISSRRRN